MSNPQDHCNEEIICYNSNSIKTHNREECTQNQLEPSDVSLAIIEMKTAKLLWYTQEGILFACKKNEMKQEELETIILRPKKTDAVCSKWVSASILFFCAFNLEHKYKPWN